MITSGASLYESISTLTQAGYSVVHVITIVDRLCGGEEYLRGKGYDGKYTACLTINSICAHMYYNTKYHNKLALTKIIGRPSRPSSPTRSTNSTNSTTCQRLHRRIYDVQSPLCVAIDSTDPYEVYRIACAVSKEVCMIKIHSDTWIIPEDMPDHANHMQRLADLASTEGFLIMEDRKLADIGKTNVKQLNGALQIEKYCSLITVHTFSITEDMIKARRPGGIEYVVIQDMSHSLGKEMTTFDYQLRRHQEITQHGQHGKNTVCGFVTQDAIPYIAARGAIVPSPLPLYMIPGISNEITAERDQRYITIAEAFARMADIIIVGRDICNSDDPGLKAREYKELAWADYKAEGKKELA